MNLRRLILSSDICVNPGPEQCSVWSNAIGRNHRAVSCDKCDSWCHVKCGNVLLKEYRKFQQMGSFDWICPPFFSITLPPFNPCYNIDNARHVDMERNANRNSHKGVKCFLANARSLKNKFQDLHAVVFAEQFDILATKLFHLVTQFTEETAKIEEEVVSF